MEHQKHKNRRLLAKNSLLNLLGQILPMAAGVLTIPYIVKGLGTNGYGILSIAWMVLGYFGLFDLGLSRATVKFVAENLSPEKVHKIPELVWTSLSMLVGAGCIGGLLVAACVPFLVTHFFKMPASFVGEAKAALLILSGSMPIILGTDALRGVLEAAQRFDLVNLVKVPSSICFYLVAALVIPFGIRVSGIVLILMLIRLATGCIYLVLCFRVFPSLRGRFYFSRAAVRPLANFSSWIMVSNVTAPIGGYLERFLIASVLSVGMLTYYSVPFDLVGKAIIFPASLAPALFPYYSYHSKIVGTEISDITSRSIKYLLLVMTPVTAIAVFFAKDILQLWLGTQFATQSTVVMQLVAFIFFFNAFAYIPYTSVQALGRPKIKAMLDLIVLPVYGISGWWLTRHMGINGAALAKLFVTILDCSVLFAFARSMRSFSPRDCFRGPLLRALLQSALLFFAVYLIHSLHTKVILSVLLLILCLLGYVAGFWVLAVDDEDRTTLRGLAHRARSFITNSRPSPILETGGE